MASTLAWATIFYPTTVQLPLRSDFHPCLLPLILPRAAMLIWLGNASASNPSSQEGLKNLKTIPLVPPHLLLSFLSAPLRLCTQELHFFQIPSMNISFSYPGTSHKVCLLCLNQPPPPLPKHTYCTYHSSFIFQLECHFLSTRHSHAPHMRSSSSVFPS